MSKFLHVYSLVIPFVVGTQAAFGDTLPGETKKGYVLALLQAASKTGEAFPNPVVAEVSFLIDIAASVFLSKGAKVASVAMPGPLSVAP